MEKNINHQLYLIEKSIKWVKETDSMKGAKGESAYRKLVDFRRKLKKKIFALEDNPAAVLYGESQVGKSYLVSSLLSESGQPFNVIDGNNNKYDFINTTNPIGKGTESTSLVTRFSTDYLWKNPNFPIKAKLLSPADLVLVICDGYFNNVVTNIDLALRSEEINNKVLAFQKKYESTSNQQSRLDEDDIYDIYDYFHNNFSTKAANIIHSDFFTKVPLLIGNIPIAEWNEVLSLLWNNNDKVSSLFSELLRQYQKLEYAKEVYLPIEAVLRDNGTVLDVSRLYEIFGMHEGTEPNYQPETSLMICENDQERIIDNFSKSYLCALTSELVFKLPKELELTKSFLKDTDLLDFPGAKHYEKIHEQHIEDSTIPKMLLRGKVAYLFNKYSYSEKINILLFCHNDRQSAQSEMPELLNNWITDMIGKTAEERNAFIASSKVPPLFIISTMFNLDLQYDFNNDREGNRNFMDARWEKRFLKILKRDIFYTETYNWINNWTTSSPHFKNIYLLRDFYYSSETNSKIFEGYNDAKVEKQEIFPPAYTGFRKDLRQSFIEFDFVKQHFENPEISWDRAASINEDGSQLIIDKLTIAANNINEARFEKTKRELRNTIISFSSFLKEYYNSSDKADNLLKAIATAGNIQANLDIAFGQNPCFFGTLMKELMIKNSEVYNIYLKKIRDIERRDYKNIDKYTAIRMNVPELNPNESYESNLGHLCIHYEKTPEECHAFFNEQKIDLNELFFGDNQRVKSFSQELATELEKYWFENHMIKNQENLAEIFTQEGLQSVQDMLRRLYKKLEISEKISNRIKRYVDGYRNIEEVYEMIADISTEMINMFINSVGIDYYEDSNFMDLQKARENINGLSWEHEELVFENNSKDEVADLITKMGNLSELLNQNPLPKEAKRLPNYRNYIIWYNLLKTGFVTASGVPDYDPISNEKLGLIIRECESIEI